VLNRRTFLCGLALGTLSAPLAGEAQQTGKVYRIGILSGGSPEKHGPQIETFLKALHGMGWIDGQNIVIEWRSAEGRPDRLVPSPLSWFTSRSMS
jgi:putative ABC transport system substrate-binding protein